MSCRAKFNTMTNFSNFMIKTRQKEGKQTGEKIDHQIIYIYVYYKFITGLISCAQKVLAL